MNVRAWHLVLLYASTMLPSDAVGKTGAPVVGRTRIVYEVPKKVAYREIYDSMRERRVLERVAAIIGLVRLPMRLTYRLKECAGELNA